MDFCEIKKIDYEAQAKVMKALAHPSRLLIVHSLKDHELCVCELHELMKHNLSTVSRHLSVLKNAGLITEDKRGLYVYYKLAVPCLSNFLGCINRMVCQANNTEPPDESSCSC